MKSATRFPHRPALQQGDRITTYANFAQRALALGGSLLDSGLRTGDRVAVAMNNRPELLETIYGCFAAGLIVVPINARLHPLEMAYITSNSDARAFIHGPEFEAPLKAHSTEFASIPLRIGVDCSPLLPDFEELATGAQELERPVDAPAETPCWLFYTSGTTGRPKGATWTHRTVSVVVMNYLADVYPVSEHDVMLHVAPLSHGSGVVALTGVARGAHQVILDAPSFSPAAVFESVERFGVTHIAFMAPTQIIKCVDEYVRDSRDLSSLRAVCYGGAPISLEKLKQAIDTFGPVWVQIYGQGECPMTATVLPAHEHARFAALEDPRLGSAGFPRTDVEVRVVDHEDRPCPPGVAGEIVVSGDVVMRGYWDQPEETADVLRGGMLHTGDVGAFDETGYLFILDRIKDVIITGGNNVYPREVEDVLLTHPDVSDVVVVGIPDAYWGEAVHAVVVPTAGTRPTAAALITHCGERIAGYKKPKSIEFVDELPMNAYGKVLRREVRQRYWEHRDRVVAGGDAGP
jgi:acyl-CoA synthetase (AMP-forming)/AMP-acid ligase II